MWSRTFMVVLASALITRLTDRGLRLLLRVDSSKSAVPGLIDSGSQLDMMNNLLRLARRASSFLKAGKESGMIRRAEQLLISWLAALSPSLVVASL